jgi:protein-L-isoaspartate(D-aspartate) O-methyltransferase
MDANWISQRSEMLERQLIRRGIRDQRVLAAMAAVPREEFIPPRYRANAYQDAPQPIGYGQTISQPYMVALMAQLLELQEDARVLDVGTGCGYAAAVLSHLCHHVYSIELLPQLADSARERLLRLGYANICVSCGDGNLGWPEHAPYDGINVAAAAHQTPPALLEQLALDGRMLIPLGERHGQRLMLYARSRDGISMSDLSAVEFVELRNSQTAP